jgi:glycopeptide antibiotics resistance protein
LNSSEISTERWTIILRQLLRKWSEGMVVSSFILVLFMTLFPFNFQIRHDFSWTDLNNHTNPGDFLVNIPFFIPWGVSLTYFLYRRKLNWLAIAPIVLVGSIALSSLVELLQLFVPTRSSTPADVVSNTLGGIFGLIIFYFIRLQILSRLNKSFLLKGLTIFFVGYLSLSCLLSMPLAKFYNLNLWDSSFPLLIGNESTGDRPWQGYISQLYLSDLAIDSERISKLMTSSTSLDDLKNLAIAHYSFTNGERYLDKIDRLPKLSWQGNLNPQDQQQGVLLTGDSWLSTEKPATLLKEKIAKTSQFTIITKVATTNTEQTGPARIISYSKDPLHSNFILGQEGQDLVFRLRTPLTGKNGDQPELVIPGVFSDILPHRLVITYAGSIVKIYVDTPKNTQSLELVPGTVLMSYLLPAKAYNSSNFMLLYYGIIFIPLGICLGVIYTIIKWKFPWQLILVINGIILPAFLLEGSFISQQGREISLGNLLTYISIAAIAMSSFYLGLQLFWRYVKSDRILDDREFK